MPGIIGNAGWDPARAWTCDFSSTFSSAEYTTAFSGGFRYRPTRSTTFSTNSGPLGSLNPSVRCGFRLNAFQIRPMVDFDNPVRSAIVDLVQYSCKPNSAAS